MGKLGEIAQRIAAKKKAHEAKADEWARRLDAIDRKEPEAFAIGDAAIIERETDMADMEKDLRQLSNFPFADSQTKPEDSGGSVDTESKFPAKLHL